MQQIEIDALYAISRYLPKIADSLEKIAASNKSISNEAIEKTKQVLIDNGVDDDEADTVLQAIGYTLLNVELQPGL